MSLVQRIQALLGWNNQRKPQQAQQASGDWLSYKEATKIFKDFTGVSVEAGRDEDSYPLIGYPDTLLPHSKEKIKRAFKRCAIGNFNDRWYLEILSQTYPQMAFFIPEDELRIIKRYHEARVRKDFSSPELSEEAEAILQEYLAGNDKMWDEYDALCQEWSDFLQAHGVKHKALSREEIEKFMAASKMQKKEQ